MIRFFAGHPTAANLLMGAFLLAGLASLPNLRRETLPDFTPEEVEVRVEYPGASAEDIEESVCLRVEDALSRVSSIEEIRCEAKEGIGVMVAKMREGFVFDGFLNDIRTEVDAIDTFPDATESPVITQLGRTEPVVSIAVRGPMSVTDLKALAEALKRRLRLLPSVSMVSVDGFSQHQLRVQVYDEALRKYGISINQIADAIARQSVDLPAGIVQTVDKEILVRFADQRRSPSELADLVVIGKKGNAGEIRLGDIAAIEDRFELDEARILFDGERAALLRIEKNKDEDALVVMDAVRDFVERERQLLPPGVELTLTEDVSSIVRDRLQLLVRNGWQGMVLVFIVMWLFFRLRLSFWVTMGLPVSFLGGLCFMGLLGSSINMITMVALIMALGLVMDDAIVIAENVATHLAHGKRALAAAVQGVTEVMSGVLASFLTTVAVFAPLAFLSGDIGKVLRLIPVVLILVLAVSLVEAFLILPNHLAHALAGPSTTPGRFRRSIDHLMEVLRSRVLGRAVDAAVHYRYAFVGVVVAVCLGTVGLVAGGYLKFRAFPDLEGDTIEARVLLPQGTPLWRTEEVVAHLRQSLDRVDQRMAPAQPGGQRLVQNVSIHFNKNLDAHEKGPHVVTLTADLLTAEARVATMEEIVNEWRDETGSLPDVLTLSFKEPVIGPAGLPIEIRVRGGDLETLARASQELRNWLASYPGVFDVHDDLRPGKPELRLRLREGALALGLDASDIANQIRAGFQGTKAADIQVGPESIEVDVRLHDADKRSLDDLEYFRIITPGGARVPLRSVAFVTPARGYARIHRIDGQRTVTVVGDVDTRLANAAEVLDDAKQRFLPQLMQKYPDVHVAIEGASKEAATTGKSILRGFLLGIVLVFLLLSFQFGSYLEPLVVLAVLPMAFIGVIWGHLVMGLELSMPSMMGFASLGGVVVNDSILLVDFLKRRATAGGSVAEAAGLASRDRFRAVLLTSLTTIAGLTPLLAEKSLQAQVLIPLATSIVFGLLASTLLVLLAVPALFTILDDMKGQGEVSQHSSAA